LKIKNYKFGRVENLKYLGVILNENNKITWVLTKRDRKQMNIFERKVYRKILGPVYDNEKENWSVLTNKEIYAIVKKPIITVMLVWACTENGRK